MRLKSRLSDSMSAPRVAHLVLDSAAFITGHDLQNCADHFYTTRDVIHEIRDKETKQRLQCLPFELNFVEPSAQDLQFVAQFSKKTGDYDSLSVVDLKVLAVTSYLQRLHVSDQHLSREARTGCVIAGSKSIGHVVRLQTEKPETTVSSEGEWITPENVADVTAKLSSLSTGSCEGSEDVVVACMTSDFAMQNVLLQSGLGLVSVSESRVIRRASHMILRCFACRTTTSDMGKKFCPGCGNQKTLKRVSVTINEKGEKEMHINWRKPISTRGTNRSLPAPRGGKHCNNPVLVEDQPVPQQKACRKALQEKKMTGTAVIQDPDYVLRINPFAVKDVTSRAARHAYVPGGRSQRK